VSRLPDEPDLDNASVGKNVNHQSLMLGEAKAWGIFIFGG
jgi:hypothetical protein